MAEKIQQEKDREFVEDYEKKILIFKWLLNEKSIDEIIKSLPARHKDAFFYQMYSEFESHFTPSSEDIKNKTQDVEKYNPITWHTKKERIVYYLLTNKEKKRVVQEAAAKFNVTTGYIYKVKNSYYKNSSKSLTKKTKEPNFLNNRYLRKEKEIELCKRIFFDPSNKTSDNKCIDSLVLKVVGRAIPRRTILNYLYRWGISAKRLKTTKNINLFMPDHQIKEYSAVVKESHDINAKIFWINAYGISLNERLPCNFIVGVPYQLNSKLRPKWQGQIRSVLVAFDNDTKNVHYFSTDEVNSNKIADFMLSIKSSKNVILIFQDYDLFCKHISVEDIKSTFLQHTKNKQHRKIIDLYLYPEPTLIS